MLGTLAAENITKEFGATLVLDGLSVTVPPGARIEVAAVEDDVDAVGCGLGGSTHDGRRADVAAHGIDRDARH